MKPTLLVIDANNLTVRRYFSRPQGGFMVDKFVIEPEHVKLLGESSRAAELEAMRQPVKAHKNVPHNGRTA